MDILSAEYIGRFFAAGFEAPKTKQTKETPPRIAEKSLTPAGKPCSVMK